jgi:hypothetical protein
MGSTPKKTPVKYPSWWTEKAAPHRNMLMVRYDYGHSKEDRSLYGCLVVGDNQKLLWLSNEQIREEWKPFRAPYSAVIPLGVWPSWVTRRDVQWHTAPDHPRRMTIVSYKNKSFWLATTTVVEPFEGPRFQVYRATQSFKVDLEVIQSGDQLTLDRDYNVWYVRKKSIARYCNREITAFLGMQYLTPVIQPNGHPFDWSIQRYTTRFWSLHTFALNHRPLMPSKPTSWDVVMADEFEEMV